MLGDRAKRVTLRNIPVLTLYADELTAARRTSPIPQLTCQGKLCDRYQPDVVQCTNMGGHGNDVEWKCDADLPRYMKFGKVEVSCEGWNSADDDYVLKGSCGLTYNLVPSGSAFDEPSTSSATSSFFTILSLAALAYLFYLVFLKPSITNARNPGPRRGWFDGWGGGPGFGPGGDGNNAPPPPYSKFGQPQAPAQGWRPGFWTGLAAGGLANQLLRPRTTAPTFGQPRARDWDRGEGPSRGGGSSSVNSNSLRSASGFGGTRNR